mmetsp:Transcript_84989/g.148824  ORF Transcript_84989/g.148824 Transcript_84989/m.148824 type:complete len:80 (-) Transcript_84989:3-242(-)
MVPKLLGLPRKKMVDRPERPALPFQGHCPREGRKRACTAHSKQAARGWVSGWAAGVLQRSGLIYFAADIEEQPRLGAQW